ncbi:MAG: serine hydrolase domain-containing protein, partial [Hydrogenophaga sp.]|nr:serine hydrolase domain-containing protein [Hydrogenophaga sp.]
MRAPLPPADVADLGLCPTRMRHMVDVFQADVNSGRLPGAVLVLARHGRIALMESVGQLDPARDAPMSIDAIFRIYSMTKPIVSVAVMMLIEQGRLKLADPVHLHLPEYANQQVAVSAPGGVTLRPVQRAATVQDLLRHTAGLTYEFLGDSPVQQRYRSENMGSRARSNAEFSQALAAVPLMFEPGSV